MPPGWIQTLGSTYYQNSYYMPPGSEGGPFRFCGGSSASAPAGEPSSPYTAFHLMSETGEIIDPFNPLHSAYWGV